MSVAIVIMMTFYIVQRKIAKQIWYSNRESSHQFVLWDCKERHENNSVRISDITGNVLMEKPILIYYFIFILDEKKKKKRFEKRSSTRCFQY